MSDDVANSVGLPGSGTEGITQLTQLSNIKSPGMWLFRVDPETVFPCTQPNLQPPYCDTEAASQGGHRMFVHERESSEI
jgi:hypothetical protein